MIRDQSYNPMKTTVYLAELDTAHFSFRAVGATEAKARAALVAGLNTHGKQRGIEPAWHRFYADGINITPMTIGKAYRDHSEL